jgi:hypothetical protein
VVPAADGLPAGMVRGAWARTEAVTTLWAPITAWPMVALSWLRWGARASTVEGPPAGQVGEGGNSPELLADRKGRKIRDNGRVL